MTSSLDALGSAAQWLLGDGAFVDGVAPLLSGAAKQLNADGVSLVHAALVVESLHPLFSGSRYVWRQDTGQSTEEPRFHGFSATGHGGILPDDLGGRTLRLAIAAEEPDGEPHYVTEARGLGATDLFALLIEFSDGLRHTVSWGIVDQQCRFAVRSDRATGIATDRAHAAAG